MVRGVVAAQEGLKWVNLGVELEFRVDFGEESENREPSHPGARSPQLTKCGLVTCACVQKRILASIAYMNLGY